ncbi:MAG: 4Fe-4S cluster-binding domain-containing protein, partial [Gammaproteobacteria bacterium]|nr:4Fe-4S cluster-binding domain-containing protein [Gammaproteobacteria bacterium]
MPTLKSTQDLILAGLIDAQDETVISRTEEDFSISISEAMQTVIQNANDPIGRQFIPKAEELERHPHEHADPIGDLVHSPVKGVVHRYPDRCLLKPIKVCAVYCRFCFRKEKVGPGNAALTPDELEQAYQYIESHPEIWEVILTGGDPLFMKPKSLGTILRRLVQIPHVEVLR